MKIHLNRCGGLTAVLLFAAFVVPQSAQAQSATAERPSEGWRDLLDVPFFRDAVPAGAAYSTGNSLERQDGLLPLDQSVNYGKLPSLHVRVSEGAQSWGALLTLAEWCTNDLSPYGENGALRFAVKGREGGEQFQIGLRDHCFERLVKGELVESLDALVQVRDVATVTREWQEIEIPLRDIASKTEGFRLRNVWTLVLNSSTSDPVEFWLADVRVTSPDKEPVFPAIKVNQVGYGANDEKYALVSGFEDVLPAREGARFVLRDSGSDEIVYEGTLTLVDQYDAEESGEMVLRADFTDFTTPGRYLVQVMEKDVNPSPRFDIGKDVYGELLKDACRYHYYQRANLELDEQYAGDYGHLEWHLDDFICPLESNMERPQRDVSQGWYDAGDFGKYTSSGSDAVILLLFAYEFYPDQFHDGQLHIPESGNGVPDILDEAKYELDFLMKMQDRRSGGFYMRVFPPDDNLFDKEPDKARFISDIANGRTDVKPTPHTAKTVAALAHASYVYGAFDPVYGSQLLRAAERGWDYLRAHPDCIPSPPGPYYSGEDLAERLAAASSLYRATGKDEYNRYVVGNYSRLAPQIFAKQDFAVFKSMAFWHYVHSADPYPEVMQFLRGAFHGYRRQMSQLALESTWRNTIAGNYYWGSNATPCLLQTAPLVVFSKAFGTYDAEIVRICQSNLNYVLGINPLRFSYVSGYGQDCLQYPFSNIYNHDQKLGVPRGILAGGPNQYQGRKTSRFNAKCYRDTNSDWTQNEHTVTWNAGLVLTAALANEAAGKE